MEFENISISLQLRESVYEKIENLLGTTCNIVLDHLRFDDYNPMKFEHILEKEKFWICVNCNSVSFNSYCLIFSFSKLEMMRYFVINAEFLDL